MKQERLCEYIYNKQPTVSNMKAFCRELMAECFYGQKNMKKIRLHFSLFPANSNAYVIARRSRNGLKFSINCNLLKFIKGRYSASLRYFYLCTTLLHEFEHIQLISCFSNYIESDFGLAMAIFEHINNAASNIFRRFIRAFYSHCQPNFVKKNHMSSSAELYCMKKSHEMSYDMFRDYLNSEDEVRIKNQCCAVKLVERNIEVGYASASLPYYKFAYMLSNLQRYIFKKPDLLQKYPILQNIFTHSGHLRPIPELCNKAMNGQGELFDQIVLRLFIEDQNDIDMQLCNDKSFYYYVEKLANDYCQSCVDFVKNKDLCSRWFDNSLIEDNTAMMIKNTQRLHKQMKKYGMKHYSGSVIPLYVVR